MFILNLNDLQKKVMQLVGKKYTYKRITERIDESANRNAEIMTLALIFGIQMPDENDQWVKLKKTFFHTYYLEILTICGYMEPTFRIHLSTDKREDFIINLREMKKDGMFGETPVSHISKLVTACFNTNYTTGTFETKWYELVKKK